MPVIIFGIAIAVAAAARSTWSPCGLSMLSQITPVAEAGRGHKFGRTAAWFIGGAALGGLTLGGAIALGALAFAALGISRDAALASIACLAIVSAATDARLLGFGPPFVRRQVNEAWLSNYRSWVYGAGFGWQIGVGVVTYMMTAAVPLMIAVGVLSASPAAAVTIAVTFGLARGLAVLLGARLGTSDALFTFHRRFDAWTEPVRHAVIGAQLVVAIACAWSAATPLIAAVVTGAAITVMARTTSGARHAVRASSPAAVSHPAA